MIAEELPDGRRQVQFGHAFDAHPKPTRHVETAPLFVSFSENGLNGLSEPRTLSSVHQVSSVIESILRSDIDPCALIKALFPCGSVVGAPKAKAFELIQMLESDTRGIYTGSLG